MTSHKTIQNSINSTYVELMLFCAALLFIIWTNYMEWNYMLRLLVMIIVVIETKCVNKNGITQFIVQQKGYLRYDEGTKRNRYIGMIFSKASEAARVEKYRLNIFKYYAYRRHWSTGYLHLQIYHCNLSYQFPFHMMPWLHLIVWLSLILIIDHR